MFDSLRSSFSTQQSKAMNSRGERLGARQNKLCLTLSVALVFATLSMWIVLRWILICFAAGAFLLLQKTIVLLESIGRAYIRSHGGADDSTTETTTRSSTAGGNE